MLCCHSSKLPALHVTDEALPSLKKEAIQVPLDAAADSRIVGLDVDAQPCIWLVNQHRLERISVELLINPLSIFKDCLVMSQLKEQYSRSYFQLTINTRVVNFLVEFNI